MIGSCPNCGVEDNLKLKITLIGYVQVVQNSDKNGYEVVIPSELIENSLHYRNTLNGFLKVMDEATAFLCDNCGHEFNEPKMVE